MARGIIVKRPGGGTAGRIIVTESGVAADDPTYAPIGGYVDYFEDNTSNESDVVDFKNDGRAGSGITTVIPGKSITGAYTPDITVNAGESILFNAAQLQGVLVTINGGYVTMAGGTSVRGRITSSVANSTLIIDQGTTMNGDLAFSGASTLSVRESSTAGAIQSDGNNYASVRGCEIKGKLEIINAKECYSSGNNVSGGTNTPNCK